MERTRPPSRAAPETTAAVVAAPGWPPTPARDRRPGNAHNGLPETWVEARCCYTCAGWRCEASAQLFGWGFTDYAVGRKRYPDNLCEPPLVCWNGLKIMKTIAIGYVRVSTDKQAEHGVRSEEH